MRRVVCSSVNEIRRVHWDSLWTEEGESYDYYRALEPLLLQMARLYNENEGVK